MNCENEYQIKKHALLSEIDSFDEADSEDSNKKIRAHLSSCVDLIESMEEQGNYKGLTNSIEKYYKALRNVNPQKPIQCFVFSFNRDRGEFFMSSFGVIKDNAFYDEFDLEYKIKNEVAGDFGPIKIKNYEALAEDVLYYSEMEDCDLDIMNDLLNELLILKAYKVFESCFRKIFSESLLEGLSIVKPTYFYVEEIGGGYSSSLTVDPG